MTHDIRKFMNLMEQAVQKLDELDLTPTKADEPEDKEDLPLDQIGRDEQGRAAHADITMAQDKDKVVAQLARYESGRYTNLAKKVLRIKQLSAEIKQLEEDVKAGARSDIADLFGAADIAYTRVVETRSFILTLTKDPKPTNTVAYAKVLTELETHLTPELIAVLETIKKKFTSTTTKAAALSVVQKESVIEEGAWDRIKDVLARLKATIQSWATSYDEQLGALKLSVGVTAEVSEEIDTSTEVPTMNGFRAGDTVSYTATEESPPATYQGKIGKVYSDGTAYVEWTAEHPKKVANRVSLHHCRTNAMVNHANNMASEVEESVDYSRIDRIEKQVEFMAKNGRSRAYIVANIGEKMGAEEAEYAGDYFDQNCAHMAPVAETEAETGWWVCDADGYVAEGPYATEDEADKASWEAQHSTDQIYYVHHGVKAADGTVTPVAKKSVNEGSLYGFQYLKENGNTIVRDDGWFSISREHMLSPEERATFDHQLAALGYVVDVDYEWSIAGGDDCPDGIMINSLKMRHDPKIEQVLLPIEGPGAYDTNEELSSDDLGENLDPLVREFNEFMGGADKSATMAFKTGSTVYCGSRKGVVKGLVPNKPDTLLVELPNGEMDAFPMSKTSDKAPGMVRKATQWVMGEDAPMVNEGDDSGAEDDAHALYFLMCLVTPDADGYTVYQADPGKLSTALEDTSIDEAKFAAEVEPKLKAAFAQVGVQITGIHYEYEDEQGHLDVQYTGKVNSSVYMNAFGAKIQDYYEGPMEEVNLDLDSWAAAGAAAPAGATVGQAIGAAMRAMLRGEYDGWGTKRGYLYIDLTSMGTFGDRDGNRVAAALNKALAPFGVSVAYDHMGSSGFSFEIMRGEL